MPSKLLGRPVKWAATRMEDFLSATHGRDTDSQVAMALDAQGKVTGLRVRTLANMGAYTRPAGVAIQLLIGPWVSTSIYDIRTIDFEFTAILSHTAPTSPYRGAGRPEAIHIIERLMDTAARKLGMDPAELRRRNMIDPALMPYTNAMGQTYDSGKFATVLDQGLALADWNGFAAREAASKKAGKLRGRGIASFLEWTGANVFEERVTVAVKGPARSRSTPPPSRWARASPPATRSLRSMSSACRSRISASCSATPTAAPASAAPARARCSPRARR